MRGLQGMRVIVAGGDAGIGAAVARRLFEEGSRIVIGDIDIKGAEKISNELSARESGRVVPCFFDLGAEESITLWLRTMVKSDILKRDIEILQMDPLIWKMAMEVNVLGFGTGIKATLPHMIGQNRGAIVNISSATAALGLPYIPAYASSKAAINALTRHTATTYGTKGVRVNGVAFEMIATESVKRNNSQEAVEEGNMNSLGRIGLPDEAAALVCYLLSDDASFVTGQTWSYCGGKQLRD
ncbi:short-chain dehydrogenase/reductase SDR [Corynespora cassiicola Philippines]|uniref:Short-chain dehydrogenase/reductase SDR n=1 Tax=Corynespora cassiicola Philippines TaxID=1448308 RepID=A0A2T2P2D3_CORCC|nr:short-chain dehydrogenase/reductase SDR [Corynespora cassiicola Philippines]